MERTSEIKSGDLDPPLLVVNEKLRESSDSSVHSGCLSGGRIHANGSSWHPIVGSFGEMVCVTCKCMNSRISCSRRVCRPDHELPCQKPFLLPTRCCKTCLSEMDNNVVSRNGSRSNAPAANTARERTSRKLRCVPRRHDVLVYSRACDGSYCLQLGLLLPSRNSLEMHTINMTKGFQHKQIGGHPGSSTGKPPDHFSLLGSTLQKRTVRFYSKLRKTKRKCNKRRKRCPPKYMERLVSALKAKRIRKKIKCHRKEISLADMLHRQAV
ncbi:PREDICTED: chordin-like protein 1 [Priapulus caudatus]|uniref:Chordin-like protein 1 n=1 Tax=Priapulus caudatus TaxID=37621 RepID=A0ABM1EAZ4_PRICU|nr:PREDICTED: chordin-like protein 1 [Priapulus caudatus]